jgi:biotin carboxyl carrier protein
MSVHKDFASLNINSVIYKTRLSKKFQARKNFKAVDPMIVTSFIPGTVIKLLVHEGDIVKRGQELLILDAMKMQNRLKSSTAGRVKKINSVPGKRVAKGEILLLLEKE